MRSIIGRPLRLHGVVPAGGIDREVERLLELVGLRPARAYIDRFPHEFSGGQRQRIAIARALALKPRIVVADEPVSALDVSIRAQILALLTQLKREFRLSMLFTTHDLGVVRHIADRVAVMYLGKVVEVAPGETFFQRTHHPYSRMLLASALSPNPAASLAHRAIGRAWRAAVSDRPAVRVPFPHALPVRIRALRKRGTTAARNRAAASRRLSSGQFRHQQSGVTPLSPSLLCMNMGRKPRRKGRNKMPNIAQLISAAVLITGLAATASVDRRRAGCSEEGRHADLRARRRSGASQHRDHDRPRRPAGRDAAVQPADPHRHQGRSVRRPRGVVGHVA